MLCLLAALFFQNVMVVNPEEIYGPAEPAEVGDLVAGAFSRRPVVTRGVIGILEPGRWYFLQDGVARVTVVALPELTQGLGRLVGSRVEVRGYVRELVAQQGTCRHRGDMAAPQSLCDNPDLPPKPDLTPGRELWPRTSITLWAMMDAPSAMARKGTGAEADAALLSAKPGEKVQVRGRFGGANQGQELPSPAPETEAWVLLVEESGVWVVGKPPRGSGFRLDPAYPGDLGKWLEVEGRMGLCRGSPCLKASRVKLSAAPKESEEP